VVSVAAGTAGALIELLRSRAGLSVATMLALTLCMLALLGLGGPFAAFLILFTPVASILILVAVNSLTSLGVLAGEAREALRSRWIAERRCPSCGYDLAGVPIEADRCRRCPECGGAWRVDDVAETIVIVGRLGTPRGAALRESPATESAATREPAT
jgi:Zn-finger nucleic acid-binding protein